MKNTITSKQIKEIQQFAKDTLNLKLGYTYNRFDELIIFEVE